MSIEVTIAINAYRSAGQIRDCIRAIERHVPTSGISFEVLVADSDTQPDTDEMMRQEFPHIRFLPFRANVGYKALVNASIEHARGEHLFLINSDILLNSETVPALLAYARAHPEAGIVGPRQIGFDEASQTTAFRFYRPWTIACRRTPLGRTAIGRRHLAWFEMAEIAERREPVPVGWLMGSALFVSRTNAERIGPMDERFFMYMEDVDWCRRAWALGLKVIYHPGCFVHHYHQRSSAKGNPITALFQNKLARHHIASAIRYFWKYRASPAPEIR